MKKDSQSFLKQHWVSICILFAFSFFLYGYKIFHYSISIDTEAFLNSPDDILRSWVGIGRPFLVLFKSIFSFFSLKWSVVFTYFFFTFFPISFSYLFWREKRKEKNLQLILLGFSILSSALFMEQLNFTLQSAIFSLMLNVLCFGVLFFEKGMETKKNLYFILSIVFITLSFGTYQTFVSLFISMIAIRIFDKVRTGSFSWKESISYIFASILIFFLSFFFYKLFCSFFLSFYHLEEASYLSQQILWGKVPFTVTIKNILRVIRNAYFGFFYGQHYFYGISNMIAFFILFFYVSSFLFKKEKNSTKFLKLFLSCALFIVPFSLTFLLGSQEVYRAQLSLVLVVTYLVAFFVESLKNKKDYLFFLILVLALCTQFYCTFQLLRNDYYRYLEDQAFAQNLMSSLKEYPYEEKRLVFLGAHNSSYKKGETMGYSFFEWDQNSPVGVGARACGFLQTLGFSVLPPTEADYQIAKELESDLEVFPKEESIYMMDDIIIVRLS